MKNDVIFIFVLIAFFGVTLALSLPCIEILRYNRFANWLPNTDSREINLSRVTAREMRFMNRIAAVNKMDHLKNITFKLLKPRPICG